MNAADRSTRFAGASLQLATILWAIAAPGLMFPLASPFLTGTSLVFLLFSLLLWAQNMWTNKKMKVDLLESLDLYVVLLILLAIIAYLVSPLPETSLPKLTVMLLGATGYFVIQGRLLSVTALRTLLFGLALAAGAVTLIALFSLEWPSRLVFPIQDLNTLLPHLTGDFYSNSNEVAGTLVFLLPFVIGALGWPLRPWHRYPAALVLVFVGALLVLTQSRGAFLSIAAMAVAWVIWMKAPRRMLLLFLLVAAVTVGLFAALTLTESPLVRLTLEELDAASKSGEAISFAGRLEIWRAAIQMLRDYPVIGAGLYTFEPTSRLNYIYLVTPLTLHFAHAHNLLLQAGASLGWGGLLLLAGLWATTFYRLWKLSLTMNGEGRRLAILIGVAVTGYLSFGVADAITLGQKPGIFVWLILAAAAALYRLAPPGTRDLNKSQRGATMWVVVPLSAVALMLLLLLTSLWDRNRANLALDRERLSNTENGSALSAGDYAEDPRRMGLVYTFKGDREAALELWRSDPLAASYLTQQGGYDYLAGQYAEAIEWYDLALALDPREALAYFWRASAWNELGESQKALDDFEMALLLGSQSGISDQWLAEIYYRIGHIELNLGAVDEAVQAYSQAITLNPAYNHYYESLGNALLAAGDEAGAAEALEKARE